MKDSTLDEIHQVFQKLIHKKDPMTKLGDIDPAVFKDFIEKLEAQHPPIDGISTTSIVLSHLLRYTLIALVGRKMIPILSDQNDVANKAIRILQESLVCTELLIKTFESIVSDTTSDTLEALAFDDVDKLRGNRTLN